MVYAPVGSPRLSGAFPEQFDPDPTQNLSLDGRHRASSSRCVIDHDVRVEVGLEPSSPQSMPVIEILYVKKKPLIKSADGMVGGPAHHQQASTRKPATPSTPQSTAPRRGRWRGRSAHAGTKVQQESEQELSARVWVVIATIPDKRADPFSWSHGTGAGLGIECLSEAPKRRGRRVDIGVVEAHRGDIVRQRVRGVVASSRKTLVPFHQDTGEGPVGKCVAVVGNNNSITIVGESNCPWPDETLRVIVHEHYACRFG